MRHKIIEDKILKHIEDELSRLRFELVNLEKQNHMLKYLGIHKSLLLLFTKMWLVLLREILQQFSEIIQSLDFGNSIDKIAD